MKKILKFLVFILVAFIYSCEPGDSPEELEEIIEIEEEVLEISDPNFKYALLNTNCVDTNINQIGDIDLDLNNDGKFQISEVESVESLILKMDFYKIVRSIDLREIKYFKNLKYLELSYTTSDGFVENTSSERIVYDFSDLRKLETLKVNYLYTDFCSSINLEGLENLTNLDLSYNRPSFLVSPDDWEYPIHFTEINMNNCPNLSDLSIVNSFLITDFCEIPSLKKLDMQYLEGGEPNIFDFHCLTQLEYLNISENYIENLILKNGSVLNTLLVNDIGAVGNSNYPFIDYLCIDDSQEEYEQIINIIDDNTLINYNCTF
ncbi:hypothetical protein [Dokdonia sp. R86516]|uniref:hypothetical protein n=1 Tax=Dokdonia sp. R86516 TaxID=3093856 RepID=UPI0037C54C8E